MSTDAIPSPIIPFSRDPETGLIKGFPYQYTPDGRIDWKAHVDRKHLYVIREKEAAVVKAQGKPISEVDLSLVDERWLRIRLAGFNQLANLRGYHSLRYHSLHCDPSKAAVVCEMEFIGNTETNGIPLICSSIASATNISTGRDFSPYLETFAENRAFARCVKRALQINILSDQEIDAEAIESVSGARDATSTSASSAQPEAEQSVGFLPYQHLAAKCRNHKDGSGNAQPITFEALKARTLEVNSLPETPQNERTVSDPSKWGSFEDIPAADVWLLMGKIEAATKKVAAPEGKASKRTKA
jgi:hypothetical protein